MKYPKIFFRHFILRTNAIHQKSNLAYSMKKAMLACAVNDRILRAGSFKKDHKNSSCFSRTMLKNYKVYEFSLIPYRENIFRFIFLLIIYTFGQAPENLETQSF